MPSVEELPAGLLGKLEGPAGKVISDRVSENVLGGLFWGDVAALARRDENQFALLLLATATPDGLLRTGSTSNREDTRRRND